MTATTLHAEYAGMSQADILGEVCRLTDQINRAKAHQANKKSYNASVEVQRLTRQRAELQALLNKPRIVWSAP